MAPNPQCAALANAMQKKGATYAGVATQIGSTEQHVIDICTGKTHPTAEEFKKLTQVLDIRDAPPADSAHATK